MKNPHGLWLLALAFGSAVSLTAPAAGEGDLVQIKQDFSADPGWEGMRNRIIAGDPPRIRQDFGWSMGKIGGVVWQSRTPAWCAMPLEKVLSWDDAFSFSCAVEFPRVDALLSPKAQVNGGNAYLGFFNDERQGYRPWSSVAIRFNSSNGPDGKVGKWLTYMSADWGDGGGDLNLHNRRFPTDGKPHVVRLSYVPDAKLPAEWPDPKLKTYLGVGRVRFDDLLKRVRQDEPQITQPQLEDRLSAAIARGLVKFARIGGRDRGDENTWEVVTWPVRGAICVDVDDQRTTVYLREDHRRQSLKINRFGMFNHQVYHQFLKFYMTDLTINGKKIDLSRDPDWQAKGNRAEFVEQDFQRQDFGYSPNTHFSGGTKGEIGGSFARTAWNDPNFGYYADDVGKLTLNDPVSFSGKIGFASASADSGMYVGYFNAAESRKQLANANEGRIVGNALGMVVEAVGGGTFDFAALASPPGVAHVQKAGTRFAPRDKPYAFTFAYDPKGGDGLGQIQFSLDGGEPTVLKLTKAQREAEPVFDRFGILSRRTGGMYMVMYFDDLTYTARRPKDWKPVRHEQKVVTVPFPKGGREQ